MQMPNATRNSIIIKPFLEKSEGGGGYTTAGGIYIPSNVEEKQADKARIPHAIVVSVGLGVDEVAVGDEIIYNKFGAKQLGGEYEEFFNINIHEVMGVVTREA